MLRISPENHSTARYIRKGEGLAKCDNPMLVVLVSSTDHKIVGQWLNSRRKPICLRNSPEIDRHMLLQRIGTLGVSTCSNCED